MPGRSQSKVNISTLHIPIHLTSAQAYTAVLTHLIKHLLFIRGQLPTLYDALLQAEIAAQNAASAATTRSRRPGRDHRKRIKFLEESEALFHNFAQNGPTLFSSTSSTSVFFLLGASTSAPREAYEFIFPPISLPTPTENAIYKGQIHSSSGIGEPPLPALCRQVLRDFAMQSFDLPEGSAPERRCKAFLLFEGGGVAAEQQESMPRGFTLRRDWRLRLSSLKKCTHTKVVLHEASKSIDLDEDAFREFQMEENGAAAQRTWLLSTAKLQGIVRAEAMNR